jgi:hypothetical protein
MRKAETRSAVVVRPPAAVDLSRAYRAFYVYVDCRHTVYRLDVFLLRHVRQTRSPGEPQ